MLDPYQQIVALKAQLLSPLSIVNSVVNSVSTQNHKQLSVGLHGEIYMTVFGNLSPLCKISNHWGEFDAMEAHCDSL